MFAEDAGNPLKDFIPPLLHLVEHQVPFFFHAGETSKQIYFYK